MHQIHSSHTVLRQPFIKHLCGLLYVLLMQCIRFIYRPATQTKLHCAAPFLNPTQVVHRPETVTQMDSTIRLVGIDSQRDLNQQLVRWPKRWNSVYLCSSVSASTTSLTGLATKTTREPLWGGEGLCSCGWRLGGRWEIFGKSPSYPAGVSHSGRRGLEMLRRDGGEDKWRVCAPHRVRFVAPASREVGWSASEYVAAWTMSSLAINICMSPTEESRQHAFDLDKCWELVVPERREKTDWSAGQLDYVHYLMGPYVLVEFFPEVEKQQACC